MTHLGTLWKYRQEAICFLAVLAAQGEGLFGHDITVGQCAQRSGYEELTAGAMTSVLSFTPPLEPATALQGSVLIGRTYSGWTSFN